MKFYFGSSESVRHLYYWLRDSYNIRLPIGNVLSSYYYLNQSKNLLENLRTDWEYGDVFIDSGAFSAYTIGNPIQHDAYLNWIKQNRQYLELYAYLDDISDYRISIKNVEYAIENGFLDGMPIFHFGEPLWVLEYYLERFDYVGLGGMATGPLKPKISWLELVFSKYPSRKYHGFGVSSINLLRSYPFYSADSTGWVLSAANGIIYYRNGSINVLFVSDDVLSKYHEKEYRYFVENLGIKEGEVTKFLRSKDWKPKRLWNYLVYYYSIQELNRSQFDATNTLF